MCVFDFLHEFYQHPFLKLFKLKTKCKLKLNDIFVLYRFKMYLQLNVKKGRKDFLFFIRTLAKQNETQGAFTNMINTLRLTNMINTLRVTKCFETQRKHTSLNIC
mgnify:CR=1 FL=1